MTFTWNKFEYVKLNIPRIDNSCGVSDFSHCASIFWFTSRNVKNVKMNFYGEPKMFFCMIISYTYDMCLKLEI